MQQPRQCTAIFEDKQVYNDKFTHLHFEMKQPHRLEFMAGQYINLGVDDQGTQRAYSIASDPDIKHGIEILLDVTPQGKGVTYLQNLEFGQEIEFKGPMGQFTVAEDNDEQALTMVGTGCGAAPLRSMIVDQLKNKQDQRPIILYWGLRHEEDMIWEDDLSLLMDNYSNFSFHPVLSRSRDEWPLCRGHVTDCLQVHDLLPDSGYYICGCRSMVKDVKKVLADQGVSANKIHNERFY